MLTLSTAATLVKSGLVDSGAWVILITLTAPDDSRVIRICSNTVDIIHNNLLYSAFPFSLDEITEATSGELPVLSLKVSNVNRLVQSYIEQDPSLGSGWDVNIQVAHYSGTQNFLTYSEDLENASWINSDVVIFTGDTAEFLDPFGLTNAIEIVDNALITTTDLHQVVDSTGRESLSFSLYIKQNQADADFNLDIVDTVLDSSLYSVNFNLIGGVVSFSSIEAGSGVLEIEEEVSAIVPGWNRVHLSITGSTATSVAAHIHPSLKTEGTTNRFLIYGPQLASSKLKYTPTGAIALTDGVLAEPELNTSFISLSVGADKEWVVFQIGMANPLRKQVPRLKYLSNYCQHTYKDSGCGYTGTLPTCGKSFAECDTHFPGDVILPFLAFPGLVNTVIYN